MGDINDPIIKKEEEDIPVQNRSRWPRIDEKEIINETHLQDLYHATGIKNLLGILEDNSIKLTFAGGSTADMSLNKKYPFFLSTMRQKFGAYARGSSSSGGQGKGYISYNVIIHLDGTKLSSAGYKIFPVDYWDMGREHSEQEERIVSDKDEIKPLNTYIKDIHIFVDTEIANNFILGYFHQVNELSKKYSFPVYFYSKENEKYFRSHRIEGAVRDLNQLNFPKPNYSEDDLEYLKRSKGWTRNKDRSYITALINVYYDREPENKDQEYWKEHLIRSLKYYSYETASCVMADIHNSKGEHPEEFREIVKIMKKEGVHTIRDLINKLIERYKNK
jgi:hypothetical protein